MNIINVSLVAGAAFALAACNSGGGSSTGGGGGGGGGGARPVDLAATQVLFDRAFEADVADPSDLVGTASLSGAVVIESDGDDSALLGNLDMVADFDNSAISGSATSIAEYDASACGDICGPEDITLTQTYNGQLNVDGQIFGGGMSADLTGEISGRNLDDGGSVVATVDADMGGLFLSDADGLLVAGEVFGEVDLLLISPSGETSSETITIEGGFAAAE